MKLWIDGAQQHFTPLQQFREEHSLPPDFGINTFQEKGAPEAGSINGAGVALAEVRRATVDAVPDKVSATAWDEHIWQMTRAFEESLQRANAAVGLSDAEISFAVAGFEAVSSAWANALLRATLLRQAPPAYETVYAGWLADSTRTGAEERQYMHNGNIWRLWIVHQAYGRVGFKIDTGDATHYVTDRAYACPAETFMAEMLRDFAERMQTATVA